MRGLGMRWSLLHAGFSLVAFAVAAPAYAQRTDDNAVADADDAFGSSIGGEQIGIYSPDNVRGFSPVAAGNVRIEGLYFDQQAFPTDRIIESRTVRVGISAQGYPFPAPTGIAEYGLRKPGADALLSSAFIYGPFNGWNVELDGELPLIGETLGLTAGFGLHRANFEQGTDQRNESYGLTLQYKPSDNFSVQPFYGYIDIDEQGRPPLVFTSGDFLPNEIERPDFFGQDWTEFDAGFHTLGVVSRGEIAGFDLGLGVFRSEQDVRQNYNDLLFDTDENGIVGDRVIVAEQDNRFASNSAELRASRHLVEGPRRHSLHLSLRGRALDRRYGGASVVSLGQSVLGAEDDRPMPEFTYGEKSKDEVRQRTFGVGYELRWRDVGEANLGVQKTWYRKSVTTPTGELPESRDNPLLFSATAAGYLTSKLAVYGGFTRGLEESDVAPANAVNRNEAPPAIITQQYDFGLRYAIAPGLSLIAGYFSVEKPYFNLDGQSRFRELGTVANRGFEASIAGRLASGLTINAGATWLDAKVSGEQVDAGLIGDRPIGNFRLRTLANVNWDFPWHKPLTLTARFESTSSRVSNSANTLFIPPRSVTSLGARYRTSLGKTPVLVRATVDNIFDKFGWGVGGSGFFFPNAPRRFSMVVAADW